MSRTMLFVQTGDARPKCVSSSVGFDPAERMQGQMWLADSGCYVWWTAYEKAIAADRWWLVEYDSAEWGRMVIAHHVGRPCRLHDSECPVCSGLAGRILASGGKEMR